jgi:hypothetical protein
LPPTELDNRCFEQLKLLLRVNFICKRRRFANSFAIQCFENDDARPISASARCYAASCANDRQRAVFLPSGDNTNAPAPCSFQTAENDVGAEF